MVFSSAPVYLNQPNWQQQQTNHDIQQQDQAGGCVIHHNQNAHLLPAPPPPHPPQSSCSGGEVGTAGSLRPGSMAERARQANIPQPEAAQKCPRCDSTNTKFCYFNNYSRTQPRHFCKACRRYWTRGGALRSVPVGGGCRRNKRSKGSSNRSKSPATAALDHHSGGARSSTTGISPGRVDMLDHTPRQPQFPFLPSLQHLGSHPYGGSGDIVVNNDFAQSSTGGADMEFLSTGLSEQWRMQHQAFPFMGNSERPIMNASTTTTVSQLFPNFGNQGEQNEHIEPQRFAQSSKPLDSTNYALKIEGNIGNSQGLNPSRNLLGVLGINPDHHQYNHGGASGNTWIDSSSFSTTSSTHNLL